MDAAGRVESHPGSLDRGQQLLVPGWFGIGLGGLEKGEKRASFIVKMCGVVFFWVGFWFGAYFSPFLTNELVTHKCASWV